MSFSHCDSSRKASYLCRCSCGTIRVVSGSNLVEGKSISCGCRKREESKIRAYKHGEVNTRLYHIWGNMLQRCGNPKHPRYSDYGGRGINVCKEWLDYCTFADWAKSHGYSDTLSIDRIDNDGGYSPNNCRWATPIEQRHNQRCTKRGDSS